MNKIIGGPQSVILLFLIALTACYDNSGCADQFSDTLQVRFFRIVTPDSIVEEAPPLIRVTAEGASRVLFDSLTQRRAERMSFPVNIYSDTTRYAFALTSGEEWLEAIFERSAMLINPECGPTQSFSLDTVFSSFDSTRISNRFLRYGSPNVYNLEIYFK